MISFPPEGLLAKPEVEGGESGRFPCIMHLCIKISDQVNGIG